MYIRDAKKREEVWLLDRLEEFGFEDPAFRSRDYVFAIDEDTGEKTGFGRLRVHTVAEAKAVEVTCIGVLPDWRGEGIGAHIVERLVEMARDQGFDVVYAFTPLADYCAQFGFAEVEVSGLPEKLQERHDWMQERYEEATAMQVGVEDVVMPPRLRRRFHDEEDSEAEPSERPEDFGIDPDTASYKYDTGRR